MYGFHRIFEKFTVFKMPKWDMKNVVDTVAWSVEKYQKEQDKIQKLASLQAKRNRTVSTKTKKKQEEKQDKEAIEETSRELNRLNSKKKRLDDVQRAVKQQTATLEKNTDSSLVDDDSRKNKQLRERALSRINERKQRAVTTGRDARRKETITITDNNDTEDSCSSSEEGDHCQSKREEEEQEQFGSDEDEQAEEHSENGEEEVDIISSEDEEPTVCRNSSRGPIRSSTGKKAAKRKRLGQTIDANLRVQRQNLVRAEKLLNKKLRKQNDLAAEIESKYERRNKTERQGSKREQYRYPLRGTRGQANDLKNYLSRVKLRR